MTTLAPSPTSPSHSSVRELGSIELTFQAIQEHLSLGRLTYAEALLQQCLEDGCQDIRVAKYLAMVALKRGDASRAVELIGQVVAVDDRDAEAYTVLSAGYRLQGEPDKALSCAERAWALEPDSTLRAMNLAMAEWSAGRRQQGLARLERAAQQDTSCAELAYNLGTLRLDAGRPDQASAEFSRAVSLDPKHAAAWANLAAAQCELGDHRAAAASIEHAVRCDPLDSSVQLTKAGLLNDLGDSQAANRLFDKAIEWQPASALPRIMKAIACMRRGSWTEAIDLLVAALRLDATDLGCMLALAHCLRCQGRLDASLLTLERLASQGEEGADLARVPITELMMQLGRSDDSLRHWDAAMRERPGALRTLAGVQRLLVIAELDPAWTIALLRYLPMVAQRGIELQLAVPAHQADLAAQAVGVSRVLLPHDSVPEDVAVVPLRRLPWLLQCETQPYWDGPYLSTAAATKAAGPARVGIFVDAPAIDWSPVGWQAPRQQAVQQPLVSGLDEAAAVTFVTLPERATFAEWMQRLGTLDLLVAVDGPVAQLALAGGTPTVVMLTTAGAWAWPERSELADSNVLPWYPNATVLRQSTPGDFSAPLAALSKCAAQLVARQQASPPNCQS